MIDLKIPGGDQRKRPTFPLQPVSIPLRNATLAKIAS